MNKIDRYNFIWKSIQIHGYKYDYRKVNYINCKVKVCIICPEHGEFWQSPDKHINRKQGCPECAKNKVWDTRGRVTTEDFIKKSVKIHGNKYNYSKVNYIDNRTKICIICPEHGEFWQTPDNHLNKYGCTKCKNEKLSFDKRCSIKNFIDKAIEIHGNIYDYSKVVYINNNTKVCIICPEHGEFWQTPDSHINNKSICPLCANYNLSLSKKIPFIEFVKKAIKVHGDKYIYYEKFYTNMTTKMKIICKKHGYFNQLPSNHISNKQGCPICNESKLEKEIALFLDKNNIKYERQKRFKWLGWQSLDFYIPKYNIGIECQGRQHFNPVDYFGGEYEFLKVIERDKLKYNKCKEHNIDILYYANEKSTENIEKYIYTDKELLLNKINHYNGTNSD